MLKQLTMTIFLALAIWGCEQVSATSSTVQDDSAIKDGGERDAGNTDLASLPDRATGSDQAAGSDGVASTDRTAHADLVALPDLVVTPDRVVVVDSAPIPDRAMPDQAPTVDAAIGHSIPARIMCIGDSISEGISTGTTYRSYLYQGLVNAGLSVDFVGDNRGTCGNINAGVSGGWDGDHCCFYSARASEILNGDMPANDCSPAGDGNIHDWAPAYNAHVAIIHLGTNDCRGGASAANIQSSLAGIIGQLRAAVPNVKVIVSQIISSRDSSINPRIEAYNNSLPAWVATITTSASPVVLVDQWTGWNANSHQRDTWHPNDPGAALMSSKFLPVVLSFFDR